MILPTIHLGGTKKDALVEQLCEVSSKLREALKAFDEASPNARDYHPQGPNVVYHAQREMSALSGQVRWVLEEIEKRAEAISDL